MAPKLTLYMAYGSPPSRACFLLLKYLKLDFKLVEVDLVNGEQKGEAFRKINPVGKVPVLVEDEFVIVESRAIMAYLVNTRFPGSDLYPSDHKKRALVDSHLYYDATVVFERLADLVRPGLYFGIPTIPQKTKDDVRAVLKVLDSFLEGKEFFAGENLTLADFSTLPGITSLDQMGYELADYPNLNKWFKNLHTLPGFEENVAGAKIIIGVMPKIYPEHEIKFC